MNYIVYILLTLPAVVSLLQHGSNDAQLLRYCLLSGHFDMPRGPATVLNVSSKYSLMHLAINVKCKFTVTHTIIYVNADLLGDRKLRYTNYLHRRS